MEVTVNIPDWMVLYEQHILVGFLILSIILLILGLKIRCPECAFPFFAGGFFGIILFSVGLLISIM